MNHKTIFHLARHGQTKWNVEQRIQGQLDSALTENGQQQARQLAHSCLALNVTQILTSHLGRALQTANICAQILQLPYEKLAGIEERNFGLWQGKLTTEMRLHVDYDEITSLITDCLPEQGESAKQLLSRFELALKQQFQYAPNDNYLIITHGDVLRCFISQLLKQSLPTTGYDYHHCHLFSVIFNHDSGEFSPL